MEVLKLAKEKNPARIWWCEKRETREGKLQEVRETVKVYNEEGYSTMTQDKVRNIRYEMAIVAACKEHRQWLEIGPGAHACLTRMVLKQPCTTVLCIEGNKAAHDEARLWLKPYKGAVKLIYGMSSDMVAVNAIMQCASEPLNPATCGISSHTFDAPERTERSPTRRAVARLPHLRQKIYVPDYSNIKRRPCLDPISTPGNEALTTAPRSPVSCEHSLPPAPQQPKAPTYALVQEVLGLIASSEGVCKIIGDLQHLGVELTAIVPMRAATFFAPAYLSAVADTAEVYVAESSFALFRKLEISALLANTQGSGVNWNKAGLFEFLDFAKGKSLTSPQKHRSVFISETDAQINGLSSWIWCETMSSNQSLGRLAVTEYPYGCPDVPPDKRAYKRVDFSSRVDDGGAAASAWRNVFFPFAKKFDVPAGAKLLVDVTVSKLETLAPSYEIEASLMFHPKESTIVPDGSTPSLRTRKKTKSLVQAAQVTPLFKTKVENFYPVFHAQRRS